MNKLYKIEDINFQDPLMGIKKVEIIYELKTNEYRIFSSDFSKNIICVNGSCELHLSKNDYTEIITLADLKNKICIDKDIDICIKNYSVDLRIVVEYLKDGENSTLTSYEGSLDAR